MANGVPRTRRAEPRLSLAAKTLDSARKWNDVWTPQPPRSRGSSSPTAGEHDKVAVEVAQPDLVMTSVGIEVHIGHDPRLGLAERAVSSALDLVARLGLVSGFLPGLHLG
jgi:hypothetical protein